MAGILMMMVLSLELPKPIGIALDHAGYTIKGLVDVMTQGPSVVMVQDRLNGFIVGVELIAQIAGNGAAQIVRPEPVHHLHGDRDLVRQTGFGGGLHPASHRAIGLNGV